jgi:hypothetical protein
MLNRERWVVLNFWERGRIEGGGGGELRTALGEGTEERKVTTTEGRFSSLFFGGGGG